MTVSSRCRHCGKVPTDGRITYATGETDCWPPCEAAVAYADARARLDPKPPPCECSALRERIKVLEDAATELLWVAELRGDSKLPPPPDDPKSWTARMQTAWNELETVVNGDE